jgi:hypothetical protein
MIHELINDFSERPKRLANLPFSIQFDECLPLERSRFRGRKNLKVERIKIFPVPLDHDLFHVVTFGISCQIGVIRTFIGGEGASGIPCPQLTQELVPPEVQCFFTNLEIPFVPRPVLTS